MMRYLFFLLFVYGIYGVSFAKSSGHKVNKAYITIIAPALNERDTLELRVWDTFIGHAYLAPNPHRLISTANRNGRYSFEIDNLPDQDIAWMSLHLSYQKRQTKPSFGILDLFMLERGDSVVINLQLRLGNNYPAFFDDGTPTVRDNWSASFSGRGAAKYQARWEAEQLRLDKSNPYRFPDQEWILHHIAKQRDLWKERVTQIEKFRGEIAPNVWDLMITEEEGKYRYACFVSMRKAIREAKIDQEEYERVIAKVYGDLGFYEKEKTGDEIYNIGRSGSYLLYLQEYVEFLNHIKEGNLRFKNLYRRVRESISDRRIRDRIVTQLILLRYKDSADAPFLLAAFEQMGDQVCIDIVAPLLNTLRGAVAFDFSLEDKDGKVYKMSDFADRVVLLDFWFAGCIPCRTYMSEVLSVIAEKYVGDKNVQVITVSIDTKERFVRTVEHNSFLPPNAIHLYTEGRQTDHPVIKYYGVRGYPFPVLIDTNGRISVSGQSLKTVEGVKKAIDQLL